MALNWGKHQNHLWSFKIDVLESQEASQKLTPMHSDGGVELMMNEAWSCESSLSPTYSMISLLLMVVQGIYHWCTKKYMAFKSDSNSILLTQMCYLQGVN